jgi:hypothetical protein
MVNGSILYLASVIFFYPWIGFSAAQGLTKFYIPFKNISNISLFAILWVGLYLVIVYLLIRISRKESMLRNFSKIFDKISVLGKFYLVIDCGSLMFTIFRLLL